MATLEKIRKRSVLLLIVIAVALLAFILGDAISNGRNLFGNGTTVAKIGGDKIDITEYTNKREELNQQLEEARKANPNNPQLPDAQALSQMALEQLVAEHLLNDAVEKMGIKPSAGILRFFMLESPQMMPELENLVRGLQNLNVNAANAQQAYDIIFSPQKYNLTENQVAPFQRQWLAIEGKYKNEIAKMTYAGLLQKSFKANNLDKKALYEDAVATTSVLIATAPYGQLDEKTYPVSQAELEKAYKEGRNRFKVEETTKDAYVIAFPVAPSQSDLAAATALSQKAAKQLAGGQLSKDLKKEGLSVVRKESRASDLRPGALKDFLTTAAPDTVKIVESNIQGFKVVKMGRRYSALDSINVRIVQVQGQGLPAKVLARLNAGLSADSISTVFSADSVMAAPAQWIPLYTAEGKTQTGLQESQLDSLLNSNGYIILNQQAEGAVLAKVTERGTPKEIVEYEEIDYAIQPSSKTIDDARAKFEKFLAANNTPSKFKANAEKEGYQAMDLQFSQSVPAIQRSYNSFYPESRQVVRWIMIDGKPGDVSHIYEAKDDNTPILYAAAVSAEYDDYAPLSNEQVKAYFTDKVRRSKAGDKMVAQYQKLGNIDAVARAMGVTPREVADMRFGRNMAVQDPAVIGKIAGTNASNKLMVLKGEDGVHAVIIKGKKKENFPYNEAEYENQFMNMVPRDFTKILKGTKKFENNSYKFEAGE
ncbi:MAG: SurA N-terminal domain-containing protein [Muribaculum sp.]|nr:SurA N-terminal domain-containing protein [Muribaculum sp.]